MNNISLKRDAQLITQYQFRTSIHLYKTLSCCDNEGQLTAEKHDVKNVPFKPNFLFISYFKSEWAKKNCEISLFLKSEIEGAKGKRFGLL